MSYYLDVFKIKSYPRLSEKFERLVHLSCESLTDPTYKFLNYIEDMRSKNTNKKASHFQTAVKESKLIPSLVYSIEKYEKLILQLSKKSKVDLHKNMKLSTLRDFKIEAAKLRSEEDEEELEEDETEGQGVQQPQKRKSDESLASHMTKKKKLSP